MNDRPFPDTLVLPFTTVRSQGQCPQELATQLQQGNTFSVPFDMTQAPTQPGGNGLVYLLPDAESNFTAGGRLELANEGLSDAIAFMSVGPTSATIFGSEYQVARIFLIGKPNGNVFSWATGMIVGDGSCIVTNGAADAEMLGKLSGSAARSA